MNERIFKLALEAMDFQGAVDIDTELKLTNSELEKFAELIVAEMLQTCEDHPGWSGRMIGEQIKQHFGVK